MNKKKTELPKISDKMMEIAAAIAKGRNDIIRQGLDVSGLERKGNDIFLKGTSVLVHLKIQNKRVGLNSLEIYQFYMEDQKKASFTFGSIIEFNIKDNGATIKGLKYDELVQLNKEQKLGLKF